MSEFKIRAVNAPQGARVENDGIPSAALGAANWLYLAATPTFAIMALLTGLNESPMDKLCSTGPGAPLGGMVSMYLLMSTFHLPPWLKLIFGRRGALGRP
jgi:hypothetical protein